MRTPPRPPPNVSIVVTTRRTEIYLSGEELAAAAGISRTRLARLVRLGLVEPDAPGTIGFTAATAGRLRRMLRLRDDLGLDLTGAAIIVDLLERLERLETELARWRGGSHGSAQGHPEP
jgi:MerR-like DNA binding protein